MLAARYVTHNDKQAQTVLQKHLQAWLAGVTKAEAAAMIKAKIKRARTMVTIGGFQSGCLKSGEDRSMTEPKPKTDKGCSSLDAVLALDHARNVIA